MIVLDYNIGDFVRIREPNIEGRICQITITREILYKVEYWDDKTPSTAICYADELEPIDVDTPHEKTPVITKKREKKRK